MNLSCFPLRLNLYLLPQLRATDTAAEPSTLLLARRANVSHNSGGKPFPLHP